jgi:hypothetical protein
VTLKAACHAGGCGSSPVLPSETRPQTAGQRAAVLERSWNAAAATGGERRQGQDRENRATSHQRRPARAHGKPRRGTVTPEVAGSSPVAPASKALLKRSFRLDTSTRGAATQCLWNVVGTPAPAAALFRLTRAGRPAHIKPALDLWDEYVGRHVGGHLPARVLDPHIDLPARIARRRDCA